MAEIEKQSGNNNLRRGNPAWGKKSEGNGKSGNPNGKPHKDCSLTTLVKSLIDTVPPGETKGRTWRQLLALAWLTGAMKNPVLMKELLDRLEGKVSQSVAVSTPSDAPLVQSFMFLMPDGTKLTPKEMVDASNNKQ